MRYLALLKTVSSPDGPPPPELFEAIGKLGEEATAAGVLVDTQGLQPSAAGVRVSLLGGDISVHDGAVDASDEVSAYTIYDVPGQQDAVDWTTRFFDVHRETWPGWEGHADLLKVFGPEDFAASAEGGPTAQ